MGDSRFIAAQATDRFDSVQALRFVAALLVVTTHSTFYAADRLDPDLFVWKGGTVGVDIFFVISGFVMMYTVSPFQSVRNGWRYFAMRRIVRIVPMYWIATTLKIVTIVILPGVAINSALQPFHVISSYLFLPTKNEAGSVEPVLGVGWTLTFEMFFYAVFAIGLLVRANPYVFASVIMILAASGHLIRGEGNWTTGAFYFDKVVLYFVIGMTIAKIVTSGFRRFIPLLVTALSLLVLAFSAVGWVDWSRNSWFRTIVVTLIFLAVIGSDRWLRRFLPKRVLYLGDASYSLYLFHPLVAPIVPLALGRIGLSVGWLSVMGSIAASLIVSLIIYQIVERPITKAARRIPYAGRPKQRSLA